jgi:hypothetical protein
MPTIIPETNPIITLNVKSNFNSKLSNDVTATTANTPLRTVLSSFDTINNYYPGVLFKHFRIQSE